MLIELENIPAVCGACADRSESRRSGNCATCTRNETHTDNFRRHPAFDAVERALKTKEPEAATSDPHEI